MVPLLILLRVGLGFECSIGFEAFSDVRFNRSWLNGPCSAHAGWYWFKLIASYDEIGLRTRGF
jgi:hypothetical protein